MIDKLFSDLLENKSSYLAASKGSEFEDRIDTKLHVLGYSRLVRSDLVGVSKELFDDMKTQVLNTETAGSIFNTFQKYERHFIYQPYGSQNYPDFLILDSSRAIPIEVKFSKGRTKKPVWNSGLPRPNGIYIFGSAAIRDLTFFRGCDVVNIDEAKQLHDFFDKGLPEYQKLANLDRMNKQPYGFAVYIRKAFEQKATFNKSACLDFFSNPKRQELEKSVIEYLAPAEP